MTLVRYPIEDITLKAATVAAFFFCDPDWIRTNDPQLRRLVLYPAELPGRSQLKKVRKGKKLSFTVQINYFGWSDGASPSFSIVIGIRSVW